MTVSSTGNSSSPSTSSTSSSAATTTNPSGVNWTALIQSQVNAMLAPATAISTTITANEAKISAYQNLQTLLSTLGTAADALSSTDTNLNSTGAFSARTADLSSTGTTAANSIIGMTLDNGAPIGSYTLTVSQLAQAQQVAGTAVASQSSALGYNGVLSIGLAGGTTANITVTPTMGLQDIAAAINAQTSTTNVQASVVQVSGSQFELVLAGTQDNAQIVTSSVSGDNVLNNLGVTDSSGNFTDQLQAAQPAEFTLDGIQITRNTNDVTDVLTGATINLLQTTAAGTSVNISIGSNTTAITTALQTLVTAYNAYRDAVTAQQQTSSDGTAASTDVLFGDSTMNDIMTQLQSAMNSTVNGLSLSDLGLSFSSSNDLQLDASTLDSTLSSNLQGVQALLASQATTSSSDLTTLASGSTAPATFTLDLSVDSSGNLTSASVNGDSTMFTVAGNNIQGNLGTPYAGMDFSFSGTSSESIVVNTTNGIASLLSGIATTADDPLSGTLQDLITNLQTQDTSKQQQVSTIQSEAATYQTQLQDQYAQYQAAIQQATTTMSFLTSLLNSESNSNA
jgi:flagellar hook-associated protein 2